MNSSRKSDPGPDAAGGRKDSDRPFPRSVREFLGSVRPSATDSPLRWTKLAGDGSTRMIFRLGPPFSPAVLIVNPTPAGQAHPDENEAFVAVRRFLAQRSIPVPEIYAADLRAGLLLVEDLGDTRLYEVARALGRRLTEDSQTTLLEHYEQALAHLVRMQASGSPGFDPLETSNPTYTPGFIVERELKYFHDELYVGFTRRAPDFDRVAGECSLLAAAAVPAAGRAVFMHRDYQSRNLMVVGGRVVVIDFQGARMGPPEYDVAALLYDPYVPALDGLRERLLTAYLRAAATARVPGIPHPDSRGDVETWRRVLLANAANRLMQALGAFAKLGAREGRPGFLEHIPAGLARLRAVLSQRGDCPALLEMVRECEISGDR